MYIFLSYIWKGVIIFKKTIIVVGSLLGVAIFMVVLGVIVDDGSESEEVLPEYEVFERDESRDNVMSLRAKTEETDRDQLEALAEYLADDVDTKTFDAAYIRIHGLSDVYEFGSVKLSSRIAYRTKGLVITGLEETNELHIED